MWAGLGAGPARAQETTGPARCTSCHDHARQSRRWQIDEPARSGGRSHVNALARLDDAKAAGFARAIGLASAWSSDGACVGCHATVFRGGPNAGVSCESCHGPASGWIELHQTRGAYTRAVAAGMRDLRSRPREIAGLCVSCHVQTDARLVAAGHPSGQDFDAGARLARIEHWTTRYDAAAVSAAARALAPRLAAQSRAPSGSTAAPDAAGTVAPLPRADAAVWQDVRPLPSDYGVAAGTPSAGAGSDAPEPDLLQPAATASLAEDALHPIAAAPPGPHAAPTSPRAQVLRLRGRALLLLARMLRERRPVAAARPTDPLEFTGPESELLRLQDEAFALLWQELGRGQP